MLQRRIAMLANGYGMYIRNLWTMVGTHKMHLLAGERHCGNSRTPDTDPEVGTLLFMSPVLSSMFLRTSGPKSVILLLREPI